MSPAKTYRALGRGPALAAIILAPWPALAEVPPDPVATLAPATLAPSVENPMRGSPAFLPSPTSPGALEARPKTDVPAGDLAFGAFQRGYFATALAEATTEVGKDPEDGSAMALIGEIYSQGLAVRTDPVEADRWFKLASERGNREGTFAYGLALLRGTGVAKDLPAAKPYLEKAAAQGHPGALYNLGVLALESDVKTRDYGGAAALFQHAADAGDIDALYALANLYKSGEGVPRDLARAAELFKKAADERHPGAQIEYGIMAFNGEGMPKDEAAAAHYFQLAAYEGNPVAANRLARLYAAGRGVAKNSVEAAHWHLLARAAGVPDPWLDAVLAGLTGAEKAQVEVELRRSLAE